MKDYFLRQDYSSKMSEESILGYLEFYNNTYKDKWINWEDSIKGKVLKVDVNRNNSTFWFHIEVETGIAYLSCNFKTNKELKELNEYEISLLQTKYKKKGIEEFLEVNE